MQFARLLRIVLVVLTLSSFGSLRASAAPFDPNNILISIGNAIAGSFTQRNTVYEFTPSGALVQSVPFNYNGSSYPATEYLRDIIVAPGGTLYGYNGTFSPYLTGYQPATNTFTHTTAAGWSTVNGVSLGGIGAFQNYIYVTDMNTNGGAANGIVRFDTTSNTSVRFGTGFDYTDLSVGLDGKLYAAYSSFGNTILNVYDPATTALLRTVTLSVNGVIAVDQLGRIFVGSGTTIYRLNSLGLVEASLDSGVHGGGFLDIDVSLTGALVLSQEDTEIVLSDSSLTSSTSFRALNDPNVLDWTVFVSFAQPVPEPGTVWLVVPALGFAFLSCASRRILRQRGPA